MKCLKSRLQNILKVKSKKTINYKKVEFTFGLKKSLCSVHFDKCRVQNWILNLPVINKSSEILDKLFGIFHFFN